jgi:hypothetical protein
MLQTHLAEGIQVHMELQVLQLVNLIWESHVSLKYGTQLINCWELMLGQKENWSCIALNTSYILLKEKQGGA